MQLLAVVMGQPGADVMVGGKQLPLFAEGAGDHIEDAAPNVVRHFLGQQRDAHALLEHDLAAVGLHLARDQAQDRGLARAVPAHQTDAFPAVDRKVDAFQQKRSAEADLDIL